MELISITPRPNHMHFLNIKGACMQFLAGVQKDMKLTFI